MPNGTIAMIGIELAKAGLAAWFEYQRMSGKTDAEIDALYNEEKAKFQANHPSTLPDV